MNLTDKMTFLRQVVEMQRQALRDENLRPVFLTFNDADHLTSVLMLEFDEAERDRSWNMIAGAGRVMCAAQEDLGHLVHVTDSYCLVDYATLQRDADGEPLKADGSPWGAGDMGYAVQHQTPDAKNVSDCLSIGFIDARSVVALATVPYTRASVAWGDETVPMDITFNWDDAQLVSEDVKGQEADGTVPAVLRHCVSADKAAPALREAGAPDHMLADGALLKLAAKEVTRQTGFAVLISE